MEFVVNNNKVASLYANDGDKVLAIAMETYLGKMVVGGNLVADIPSTTHVFPGYIREFKLFDHYRPENVLRADRYKSDISDWSVDRHIIAYWRFNETYTNVETAYTIHDYSIHNLLKSMGIVAQANGDFYPRFTVINLVSPGTLDNEVKLHRESPEKGLCTYRDIYKCMNVGALI
jgi:hypothetical protein